MATSKPSLMDKARERAAKSGITDSTKISKGEVPIEGRELVALGKAGIALAKNPEAVAELGRAMARSVAKGKMTVEELAAWAKKAGVSMRQAVKAEKSAASAFEAPHAGGIGRRTSGYAAETSAARSAAVSTGKKATTPLARRLAQTHLNAAKAKAPKLYEAAKNRIGMSAKVDAHPARFKLVSDPIIKGGVRTETQISDMARKIRVPYKELRESFVIAAKRGTLPAAAALAGSRRGSEEPRQGYKYGGMVPKKSTSKKGR